MFREVGDSLKKKLAQRKTRSSSLFKKSFWVVLPVSILEVAYLRTERQWWLHNTDVCLSLLPLTLFPMAAELTGWHRHTVSQGLLMLPVHWRHVDPLTYSATGKSSQPARHFSLTPQKQVSENLSAMMIVRGSPWFLSWEIIVRSFLFKACTGRRKETRKLIYFLPW